ncbi:amidohydrolase family protein [Nonomuraea jiangxiensis]|uniref:Predicted metal-dependent hydrolase, TIM-barrel fold n=1 Tax=Nonomuraea jiangxiensis TaxID=633440 RepID=A0A1G8I9P4_9ACTN|nr:amidohydrolase family protein [Nonomuraea jiangxiensis]SDI15616.1 Predicted metal-dependent hydrolase, TIM-barrel fold [Nonomuraea jiangxiensis]
MTASAPGRSGIVDAHHHIWRAADLPWLQGEMVPRIFGPYEPIRRDYLPSEYVAEATACGISSAVYVQANWSLDRCVDEVRWLRDVHAETGWPTAVVGCADLFDEDAPDVMRRQAALTPLVRGTRLQLHWHERPEFRFATGPDRMKDPVFRRNLAALADLGWLFELQVFPAQLPDAAELVAGFPEVTFVLVHAGMPVETDPAGVAEWRRGMKLLAELPNVVVKLTGQGTFVHRVDRPLIDRVAATCLDLFGSRRCMWGSNFPIEKLWTGLPTLLSTWQEVLAGRSAEEVHDVFTATATRVYRL